MVLGDQEKQKITVTRLRRCLLLDDNDYISVVLHESNIDHDSNILILKKGVLCFSFKWLTSKGCKVNHIGHDNIIYSVDIYTNNYYCSTYV